MEKSPGITKPRYSEHIYSVSSLALRGSMYVSGKLHTYPSPNLAFCPKRQVSANVTFGPRYIDPSSLYHSSTLPVGAARNLSTRQYLFSHKVKALHVKPSKSLKKFNMEEYTNNRKGQYRSRGKTIVGKFCPFALFLPLTCHVTNQMRTKDRLLRNLLSGLRNITLK